MLQTAFFSVRVWGQSCEPIQPETEPVFMEGNSPQCMTYSENFANPNNYITVGIGTQYLSSASLAAAFGSSLENRNIYVKNHFLINSSVSFNKCIFKAESGKAILVYSNQTLTVGNSVLFSCTNMWKGINLQAQARLNLSGTTIEDAQYAVNATDRAVLSLYGNNFNRNYVGVGFAPSDPSSIPPSILNVNSFAGNQFYQDKPLTPMYVGQSPATNGRTLCGVKLSRCVTTLGMGSSFLNNFRNISTGIIVEESSDVAVSGCTFTNIGFINATYNYNGYNSCGVLARNSTLRQSGIGKNNPIPTFKDCKFCVWAENSGIQVSNNYIENTDFPFGESVIGLKSIVSTYNAHYLDINITDNRIFLDGIQKINQGKELDNTGVDVTFGNGANNISRNDIRIINSGRLNANELVQYAQHHYGMITSGGSFNSQISIDRNRVSFENVLMPIPPFSTSNLNASGFLIFQSAPMQISNNLITADALSAIEGGIYSFGSSRFKITDNAIIGQPSNSPGFSHSMRNGIFIGNGGSTQNLICHDTVNNTRVGIKMEGNCNGSTLKGNVFNNHYQGFFMEYATLMSPQVRHGNLWQGGNSNFSRAAAEYYYPAIPIPDAQFFVETNTYPLNPLKRIINGLPDNSNNWFTTEPGSGNDTCYPAPLPLIGSIAAKIINNEPNPYSNFPLQLWWAERAIFEQVLHNPALLQVAGVSSFYDSRQNTSVGKLERASEFLAQAFALNVSNSASLKTLQKQRSSKFDAISALDFANASGIWSSSDFETKSNLLTDLQNIDSQLFELESSIAQTKKTKLNELLSFAQGIPATFIYEQNDKDLLQIEVARALNIAGALTAEQLNTLRSIAAQCPLTGGTAVTKAIGMLPLCEQGDYANPKCAGARGSEANQSPSENGEKFKIYPNPASNAVTVEYPNWTEPMKMRLFNSLGVELKIFWLNAAKMEIPLQLPTGLYRLSATLPDGKTWTNTLQIINN